MIIKELEGLITAITTPFGSDGSFDQIAFLRHCQHLVNLGISGFVIAGTTGEGLYLAKKDVKELLWTATALKKKKTKLALIAGVIKPTQTQTIRQIELIEKLDSERNIIDAYLIAPPTEERLSFEHIKNIFYAAKQTGRSLIAYNIPQITGFAFSADNLIEIKRDIPELVGVKDSSPFDPKDELVNQLFHRYSRQESIPIAILPGNDRKLVYIFERLRCNEKYQHPLASISGAANFPPFAELELEIYNSIDSFDFKKAEHIQDYLNEKGFNVLKKAGLFHGESPILKIMINHIFCLDFYYPLSISYGLIEPGDGYLQSIRQAADAIRANIKT